MRTHHRTFPADTLLRHTSAQLTLEQHVVRLHQAHHYRAITEHARHRVEQLVGVMLSAMSVTAARVAAR